MNFSTPYYTYNGLEGKELWRNTDEFKATGNFFLNQGKGKLYTHFPQGSYPHKKFWDEEEYRILNGMTNSLGQTISGLHYFYLNYCPIYQKKLKRFTFPDFLDLDADWFKRIDYAETEGEHLVALKSRQRGFSLKDMVPILRNLHFKRGSQSYLGAYKKIYADKSWGFLKNYLNHMNNYTDFYKNRNPDTTDHIKMAFKAVLDGREIDKGYLSEVRKVVFKDDPVKGVGGAVDLLVYEEAGTVPGDQLLQTLEYVKPATMEGGEGTGLIIIYGSVGELEDCQSLRSIFYSPEANGFSSFENIWGDETIKGKCGYFVPQYMYYHPFVDQYGNSIILNPSKEQVAFLEKKEGWIKLNKNRKDSEITYSALEEIELERKKKKKLSSKQYITFITQNPIFPSEAFLSRARSKMPIEVLQKQLAKVAADPTLRTYGYAVKLHEDNGAVKEEILHHVVSPFNEYPVDINKQEGSEGTLWIYEPPIRNAKDLYVSSLDDIATEEAPTSDSIFSFYIFKRDPGTLSSDNPDKVHFKRQIVCSFIGRRRIPQEIYDQCALALKMYNCKTLPENINVGFISHMLNVRQEEYLVQDQMDEIKGINPGSVQKRSKGFYPTAEVISAGDDLIVKYLLEKIGLRYKDDGTVESEILGVERIFDIGLLKELIDHDGENNVDRVTSFRGCLLYEQAITNRKASLSQTERSPIALGAQFVDRILGKDKNKHINEYFSNLRRTQELRN